MTATASPIELSVHRQSRFLDTEEPNPYDPNYIPVLNGATDLKVDYSLPSFSAFSTVQPPQKQRSTSLVRTKSASAPERVVVQKAHNDESVPERPSASTYATAQEIGSSHTPPHDDKSSVGDSTATSSEASAKPALEEQVFMIPGNSMPKPEDLAKPIITHSARSSVSSQVRRKSSQVPTSRYNQKKSLPHVPTLSSTSLASPQVPSQKETPRTSPEPAANETPRASAFTTPVTTPPPEPPSVNSVKLLHMKSTASERRQRALNSHPSNFSIRSQTNPVNDDDELPLMPPSESTPRPTTSRSRSQSICNLTQPSPAPTTPLPELPPQAKRPPPRERVTSHHVASQSMTPIAAPTGLGISSPAITNSPSVPSPVLLPRANEHIEMANFMTSQKTVVFRRFDDVHVRLLLHLQDEIAALEKEMEELESPTNGAPDKFVRKGNVMRLLRKALAEYDHLFANWSQMQASKASSETREQLAKWLRNPEVGAMAISSSARDDLAWLQNSNDLSSVSIDPEKAAASKRELSEKDDSISSKPSGGRGGAGGFAALFGCASKRK